MRPNVDRERLDLFMQALGRELREPCKVYFTGGATALLEGWRESTVDIDLKIVPDHEAFAAIARLKKELDMSVELAAPDQFIPALPRWEERSRFIRREGCVEFYNLDPYSQALAKIERGFEQDLADVQALIDRGLVDPTMAWPLFLEIEPRLDHFPAIDPRVFRESVRRVLQNPDS